LLFGVAAPGLKTSVTAEGWQKGVEYLTLANYNISLQVVVLYYSFAPSYDLCIRLIKSLHALRLIS